MQLQWSLDAGEARSSRRRQLTREGEQDKSTTSRASTAARPTMVGTILPGKSYEILLLLISYSLVLCMHLQADAAV